jgi:hypothetical protein
MGKVLGLAAREIGPAADLALLDEATRERLRQQVPGWRMVTAPGSGLLAIQQEWTVKDADSGRRLAAAITAVGEGEGHGVASVEVVGGTTVVAQLTTKEKGGCLG